MHGHASFYSHGNGIRAERPRTLTPAATVFVGPRASSFAPGRSSPSNPGHNDVPPPGQLGGGPPPGQFNNPGLTNTLPPGQQLKQSNRASATTAWKRDGEDEEDEETAEESSESDFQPVSFVQPLVETSTTGLILRTAQTPTADLRSSERCSLKVGKHGDLLLDQGELLVHANGTCRIKAPHGTIAVRRGTVAIIAEDRDCLKVRVVTGQVRLHRSRNQTGEFFE